ncbi:hypothetical protein [Haladaptatus sp. CMAA 1911]|uniref:DUF7260 family protein n=1 Tax=unclassified Haladaptatus TaxID=2622732 RepID=UPI003754E981
MGQTGKRLIDHTSLPRAERLTEKEEVQIRAETEAFEDFLDRLEEIPPHPCRTDGGSLVGTDTSRSSTSPNLVLEAYRETILAVDHWEDEYRERTAHASIEHEFGPEVAAGLAGGSATWSQPLWNQIKSAAEDAVEIRQRSYSLMAAERQQLDELRSSLTDVSDVLAAIERGEFAFDESNGRLTSIRQKLDELTHDQQSYLHRRNRTNEELFTTYVYADLDTEYPGLAALATARQLLERIELRHWAGMS